jgi:hypothetical protein
MEHESRQRRRWYDRVVAELALSKEYVEKRKQRGRDLLVRQSRREKAGFYTGLSVASARAAVGRPTRRVLKDDTTIKRRPLNMVQLW